MRPQFRWADNPLIRLEVLMETQTPTWVNLLISWAPFLLLERIAAALERQADPRRS